MQADDRRWVYKEKISIAQPNLAEAIEEDYFFNSDAGNTALLLEPIAHVFKFTLRAKRLVHRVHVIGEPPGIVFGSKTIFGTISLVTPNPEIINNPFSMCIYSNNRVHVATIHDIMLTSYSSYTLIDRHVFEGDYTARTFDIEPKETENGKCPSGSEMELL